MPVVHIRFEQIQSLQDIYQQLGEQVELPVDFGRNLDALYDFLAASLAGPVQIDWPDQLASRDQLGQKNLQALSDIFADLTAERDDFQIFLNGYPPISHTE
ncbi:MULTISPECIES: barstar family protein [Deefgea]|uniref:Barnase inhibitor n=1 Tax=Deefgea chitinilytica TaxID=570276 RepID=A0ABS2C862_9NEIS|nr:MULTISPECIES: barstar family protein [Deefgea]MBM5570343.1 barnase inhibitor [Deefgea chitinilytica]MBM9887572.1 barstar family protein [Deefgea sp. CFH1-16]